MQCSEISRGTLNDISKISDLFVAVTDKLLENGVDQWNYDYPNKEILTHDVVEGWNYIIRDEDNIAATIVLNAVQDEQYKHSHWRYRNFSILVFHRLLVHQEYQGKGLGKKMCLFAEEFVSNYWYQHIRLDAYAGNTLSNAMYKKLGYQRANGYCYFRRKAIPFYCYEKKIC